MIYIVQEKGLFRSRIKIGFTNNVKGRMSGLRGGSPSALKLILLLPGTLLDEAGYHERFAAYRLHGEWFSYGLKLRLFVWANQFGVSQVNPEIKTDSELEPEPELDCIEDVEPELDYIQDIEPDRSEDIREMLLEGKSKESIAQHFGYETNSGRIFYQIRDIANSLQEPPTPNDDEMKAIEAFISVRDGGKFYWKDATRLAFGDGKFGKNYTIKLKRILDKFDVDYSNLSKEEIQPVPIALVC